MFRYHNTLYAGVQLGAEEAGLPCPFWKIEKNALILGKKSLDSVYFWVKYPIQDVVLRVSRRKGSKIFLVGPFSLCFIKVFIEVL